MGRYLEFRKETLYLEEEANQYDISKERVHKSRSRLDLELMRLKGSP
jgi:hypothetical protein